MHSLWNDTEAAQYAGDLGQRVYTSRLLGRDPSLVLHGGGNTSVKIRERTVLGTEEEILYVKGSGWDLATIDVAGFSPCRMSHLLALATLESLSDIQMANELRCCMTNASAPSPSVEAILHALLPGRFVDHTHADSLVSITNTPSGAARTRDVFGERVVVIPYVMPGFELARVCATLLAAEKSRDIIGLALLGHGLFSFGETAKESYERMIELVTVAETYLAERKAWTVSAAVAGERPARVELAVLRKELSDAMGAPAILAVHGDAAFARREDVADISQQGPATPDHVIRTKRVPMVGRDVSAYVADYERYFAECSARSAQSLVMLDPAPRVILDPEWGLCTVGRSARDASIARDIYRHTMEIIERATALGGWLALPEQEIFDVEYWDLEQAKLRSGGRPPVFGGEVALVSGAASGIGKACVDALLRRGAAVVGVDVAPAVVGLHARPDYHGVVADLTDERALGAALDETARRFGGLDMLVLNAGVFAAATRIADMQSDAWHDVMRINLDANLLLMREAHPMLRLAPNGGRVVVIGSKNVPAPGPGAAAYSVSKAALNQLARVAALEWGKDGIRINSLHPNMVFDTALWTPELLASRARHYGLSVDEYKTNNVLGVEVASRDVAELAAEMCGPLFAKTTAAQVPVDGGNERVI
jgi:rhamnose utilization protein RhaD (predicted bifunctional aldolase and dehydrogenase)/NAD(P)-dependent dehydrogenase (short-subunit alcohol dehydrogenase family)